MQQELMHVHGLYMQSQLQLQQLSAGASSSSSAAAARDLTGEAQEEEAQDLAELSELFGRAPKALAADWQEVEDPSSGNPYYWNTRTSETTWERPIGDVIDAGGFVWLSAAIEDLFED